MVGNIAKIERKRRAIALKDPRLLPEMGVRVPFLRAVSVGVLVPVSAILERDAERLIFVVEGDRVRERAIIPGEMVGDQRLIEQGVEAGERVVRDASPGLMDGD